MLTFSANNYRNFSVVYHRHLASSRFARFEDLEKYLGIHWLFSKHPIFHSAKISFIYYLINSFFIVTFGRYNMTAALLISSIYSHYWNKYLIDNNEKPIFKIRSLNPIKLSTMLLHQFFALFGAWRFLHWTVNDLIVWVEKKCKLIERQMFCQILHYSIVSELYQRL